MYPDGSADASRVDLYDPGGGLTLYRDWMVYGRAGSINGDTLWPEADEVSLADLSERWRELAGYIYDLREDVDAGVRQVLDAYGGQTGPAISGSWQALGGDTNGIAALWNRAREAAHAARMASTFVRGAKTDINAELATRLTNIYTILIEQPTLGEITSRGLGPAMDEVELGRERIAQIVDNLIGSMGLHQVSEFEPTSYTSWYMGTFGPPEGVPALGDTERDGIPDQVRLGIDVLDGLTDTKPGAIISAVTTGLDEYLESESINRATVRTVIVTTLSVLAGAAGTFATGNPAGGLLAGITVGEVADQLVDDMFAEYDDIDSYASGEVNGIVAEYLRRYLSGDYEFKMSE